MVNEIQDPLPTHQRCLIVGNYCHDVLIKDGVVIAESLGGAASFISAVLDGLSVSADYVSKVGSDFAYSVNHRPVVLTSSRTTLFHAHFSSEITRQDRILKRIASCDPILPSDLPDFNYDVGLAVGVAGEILPETLERMLDICKLVFVDIQALIRVFEPGDGLVKLVSLKETGFFRLLPRIGFLKASSEEAPYVDVDEARKSCCVVVTNGKDGCTVYWKDAEHRIAPFSTVQVDPTGAGDSFLGGFVYGVVQGLAVPDAALLGNFFGSLTVGQIGLPKLDSSLLLRVKNEVQRKRRLQSGCHEMQQVTAVKFARPLDHEQFHAALGASILESAYPFQECQWELPNSPRVVEQRIPHQCSGQQKIIISAVYEDPIKSAEGKH